MACGHCNSCNNNCSCNNKNCDKLLEKFHELVNKSDYLYSEAVEEQSEAIKSVLEAIESLEKFKCLFIESYEVYNYANELLENSKCNFNCNFNSCKCKKLDQKSDALYYKQFEKINEALEGLKEVLCDLKAAVNYGLEGDKFYEEYNKCVHNVCK